MGGVVEVVVGAVQESGAQVLADVELAHAPAQVHRVDRGAGRLSVGLDAAHLVGAAEVTVDQKDRLERDLDQRGALDADRRPLLAHDEGDRVHAEVGVRLEDDVEEVDVAGRIAAVDVAQHRNQVLLVGLVDIPDPAESAGDVGGSDAVPGEVEQVLLARFEDDRTGVGPKGVNADVVDHRHHRVGDLDGRSLAEVAGGGEGLDADRERTDGCRGVGADDHLLGIERAIAEPQRGAGGDAGIQLRDGDAGGRGTGRDLRRESEQGRCRPDDLEVDHERPAVAIVPGQVPVAERGVGGLGSDRPADLSEVGRQDPRVEGGLAAVVAAELEVDLVEGDDGGPGAEAVAGDGAAQVDGAVARRRVLADDDVLSGRRVEADHQCRAGRDRRRERVHRKRGEGRAGGDGAGQVGWARGEGDNRAAGKSAATAEHDQPEAGVADVAVAEQLPNRRGSGAGADDREHGAGVNRGHDLGRLGVIDGRGLGRADAARQGSRGLPVEDDRGAGGDGGRDPVRRVAHVQEQVTLLGSEEVQVEVLGGGAAEAGGEAPGPVAGDRRNRDRGRRRPDRERGCQGGHVGAEQKRRAGPEVGRVETHRKAGELGRAGGGIVEDAEGLELTGRSDQGELGARADAGGEGGHRQREDSSGLTSPGPAGKLDPAARGPVAAEDLPGRIGVDQPRPDVDDRLRLVVDGQDV